MDLKVEINLTTSQVREWCDLNGHRFIESGDTNMYPLDPREIKLHGIKGILSHVSDCTEISIDDIHSVTKKREIVIARQLAHCIAKKHTKLSLGQIGWSVGEKDHATVLHSIKTVKNLIATDKAYRKTYSDLIIQYSLSGL
jgi:chromosomal replication initiation ATPase DnaA